MSKAPNRDPFLIPPPFMLSFSGGRTSAYMLWRVLKAYGGSLPENACVLFANTGREMPATLDFVAECEERWGVRIVWLEYIPQPPGYREVSHNNASRNGEPFFELVTRRASLPNPIARYCTQELKIRPMTKYVRALGWSRWTNVIGLRADELHRVFKAAERAEREPWSIAAPLASAGVRKADVLAFWASQPFDLRLAGEWEGNCDGCFLKSRGAILRMFRDHPDRMAWWVAMEQMKSEAGRGGKFRVNREDYATLAEQVATSPLLPLDFEMSEECGVACAAE
jgi:3'-phosphoadenosine 5'-phosphosulfate sulfotransferase (PAPS reductase)/FAD synthetase